MALDEHIRGSQAAPTAMSAEELKSIGGRVFGYGWQTRLAKHLDVADRTVRRWIAGAPVPSGMSERIRALGSIPAPPVSGRSEAIVAALGAHFDLLADRARAVGWTEDEILQVAVVWSSEYDSMKPEERLL